MNWKLLLLAVMTTSIVKAQNEPCPAVNTPSEDAESNFSFNLYPDHWAWISEIDDIEIWSDGNIYYNGLAPPSNSKRNGSPTYFVNTVCIEWQDAVGGGYNCTGRPGGTCCSLPNVNGIQNCWGFV
jgi:hypothetical protein